MELHRVHSVKQNSAFSTGLPLELQQLVYSFLDTHSFYAARNVCRYWRYASLDSVTLEKQLRKLPILPPANARLASPDALQKLYHEAAYTLMLGLSAKREDDAPGSLALARRQGFQVTPRVCATTNGSRTVTLNDRTIGLFDTTTTPAKLLAQRPLNDLRETVGNGPWLKISPTAYNELALSSDGKLLAIAQERTIQVYDLTAEPDSFTANEYISSASGHYICGLSFEQNDHVLRVKLSGKGAVLYLGTPSPESKTCEKATMEHWKSRTGLRHTFLDSSTLQLEGSGAQQPTRLSGLQLLRPFHNGYLFASQKHGGGKSSHYVLGHVKASVPEDGPSLTAEPGSITILAKLESFLSSWEYIINASTDSNIGLWEKMPSAHEHHPNFSISTDGNLLALAEKDKKRVRPIQSTQVFLYRLPSIAKLHDLLDTQEHQKAGKWATLAGFLDKLEQDQKQISQRHEDFEMTGHEASKTYRVGRIPRCLATVQGSVVDMKFGETSLTVVTTDATRRWAIAEI